MLRFMSGLAAALAALVIVAQPAAAQTAYPIVFEDNRDLAKVGVQMNSYINGVEVPQFPNKCH